MRNILWIRSAGLRGTKADSVGILEAGAVYTLYLRAVRQSRMQMPGTISNTVNVTSQTPDPDPGNNEYTEVITLEGSADLSITKTAYPDTAISGEKLTYTIYVTNKGPSDAVNILISDALPPALENAQYSIDGVNFLPLERTIQSDIPVCRRRHYP